GAGAGRAVGTMGHPIVYGTFCLTGMCIALGLRGRLWQVPFAAGAVGMLLSGSRSAWFGIAAALAVWYLAQRRKLTRRGLYLLAGFAAVLGGLAAFGPPPVRAALGILTSRLSNLTGSASATARYRRMEAAWSGIGDNVVNVLAGRGAGAHVRFFQQAGIGDYLAQTFDNSYLTLWYDFGVGALAVLVAAMGLLFVRYGTVTVRMLVLGFAVQIWFFDFYLWPAAAGTLIVAVALAAGARAAQHRAEQHRGAEQRPTRDHHPAGDHSPAGSDAPEAAPA
ncbi:MAG: O-antigen ligase family protein, partial [Micromonosporaceae bacterium]|nr:O-antigen ligase family protein [Micromonosporaceae bacterium]